MLTAELIELCKSTLSEIADLLHLGGEEFYSSAIRGEVSGTGESLNSFLVSNELWGGPGSLADSAFAFDGDNLHWPQRKDSRAAFERMMIKLGRVQIAAGHVNMRTQMWVEGFEKWRDSGIR